MKKTDRNANGEIRPEYDFAAMKGGVRAKYLKRLRERTNIVVLEPEVAEAFPVRKPFPCASLSQRAGREPGLARGTGYHSQAA